MKRLLVAALLALSLAALAAPITARGNRPVGDRINLGAPPATMPSGTPFHITHGFLFAADEFNAIGQFGFSLQVDDIDQKADFLTVTVENGRQTRLWLHNFPDGMSGLHTFTGTWWVPCGAAPAFGGDPPPCDTPNEPVEILTLSATVDFGP